MLTENVNQDFAVMVPKPKVGIEISTAPIESSMIGCSNSCRRKPISQVIEKKLLVPRTNTLMKQQKPDSSWEKGQRSKFFSTWSFISTIGLCRKAFNE